jgi:steroid delta-isomerase-like uncharacterized protein
VTLGTNKQIIRRFTEELINSPTASLAEELIAPDATLYIAGNPEPLRGPSGFLSIVEMMRVGFPDIQWKLDDLVAEADRVAARFTIRGTHRGPFLGVPPTGKPIVGQSTSFYRLAGGKIIEDHGLPNMLGILQQIGAVPPAR